MRDGMLKLSIPQQQILGEIADARLRQRDIAMTYGLIMKLGQQNEVDWAAINTAIQNRWPKGLARIKEMAWKFAERGVI